MTLLLTAAVAMAMAGALALPASAAKGGGGGGGKPPKTTTSSTSSTTTPTTTTTTTTTTAPPDVRDPILFVHGWNSSASTWDTMVGRFAGVGYAPGQLYRYSYNTSQSNKTTAAQIDAQIDQILSTTGADQVDIIAHSMGSLSSRWYVKVLGGAASVDAWVSLGGPNHGTDTAYFCFSTACSEMRPGSSFLDQLNTGDESVDGARHATWWSPCDSVINPDSSVPVAGATNTQTACIGHSDLHQDATVFGQVAAYVD